ncbi:MAG: hypothetical protein ACXWL5_03780 [Candidatus Chromulinivorax sp.]
MTIKKAFVLGFLFALHIDLLSASTKFIKSKDTLSSKKEFPVDSRKELLKFLQIKHDTIQQSVKYSNVKKLHCEVVFQNQIKKLQSCYAYFFYSSDDGKAIIESLKPYL